MPFFEGISVKDAKDVLRETQAVVKNYEPGEVVVSESGPTTCCYLMVRGLVLLSIRADGENDHLGREVPPGFLLGASNLFAETDVGFPVSARVCQPSQMVMFRAKDLLRVCRRSDDVGRQLTINLLHQMTDRLQLCWRKLAMMSCERIEERILLYLHFRQETQGGYAIVHSPLNHQQLAKFMGVSRTTLQRALSRLVKSGQIEMYRNTYKFLKQRKNGNE